MDKLEIKQDSFIQQTQYFMVKILLYLIFLLGGYRAGGKGVCRRSMSPTHETQSMREIRLLCGRYTTIIH
jgi:hypothetical protein